jgi:hypothetical protein
MYSKLVYSCLGDLFYVLSQDSPEGLRYISVTIVAFHNSHHSVTVLRSAIFLKKMGSGTHSDPKFGRRGGGVSYIDYRKKGFRNSVPACVLLRKSFRNGVPALFVTKSPWSYIISPPIAFSVTWDPNEDDSSSETLFNLQSPWQM